MRLAQLIKEYIPELNIAGYDDETIIKYACISYPETVAGIVEQDAVNNPELYEHGFLPVIGGVVGAVGGAVGGAVSGVVGKAVKSVGNIAKKTVGNVLTATGKALSGASGQITIPIGKQTSTTSTLSQSQLHPIKEQKTNYIPILIIAGALLGIFIFAKR